MTALAIRVVLAGAWIAALVARAVFLIRRSRTRDYLGLHFRVVVTINSTA